jgi:hypothetical protein
VVRKGKINKNPKIVRKFKNKEKIIKLVSIASSRTNLEAF